MGICLTMQDTFTYEDLPIAALEILPYHGQGFIFRWQLNDDFSAPPPFTFRVQMAPTPEGPWTNLSGPVTDSYYWSDTRRPAGKTASRNYRVTLEDGDGTRYASEPKLACGDLSLTEFLMAREILRKEELVFEELFVSRPHVFVSRTHPLAKAKRIQPKQLDDFPFISFEQGEQNALYFAEEVMPAIDRRKNIRVRDRATMTNLILGLDGYTVASGALSKELNGPDVVAVPLALDDEIRVGHVRRRDVPLSRAGTAYAEALRARVAAVR